MIYYLNNRLQNTKDTQQVSDTNVVLTFNDSTEIIGIDGKYYKGPYGIELEYEPLDFDAEVSAYISFGLNYDDEEENDPALQDAVNGFNNIDDELVFTKSQLIKAMRKCKFQEVTQRGRIIGPMGVIKASGPKTKSFVNRPKADWNITIHYLNNKLQETDKQSAVIIYNENTEILNIDGKYYKAPAGLDFGYEPQDYYNDGGPTSVTANFYFDGELVFNRSLLLRAIKKYRFIEVNSRGGIIRTNESKENLFFNKMSQEILNESITTCRE
jgi:hypothetical protein